MMRLVVLAAIMLPLLAACADAPDVSPPPSASAPKAINAKPYPTYTFSTVGGAWRPW
jgi:hypothetical protein